jgi:hypothetical protein
MHKEHSIVQNANRLLSLASDLNNTNFNGNGPCLTPHMLQCMYDCHACCLCTPDISKASAPVRPVHFAMRHFVAINEGVGILLNS